MQQLAFNTVEETDCDLMLYIQLKDEDEKNANLALKELIDRHHIYLVSVGLKALNRPNLYGSEEFIQDLVMDTWKKIYDHAESYNGSTPNEATLSRRTFRAWAGRILRNHLRDWLKAKRNRGIVQSINLCFEEHYGQNELPDSNNDTFTEKLEESSADSLFSCLTEKEADVMRELLLHLGTGILTSALPHGAIEQIAEEMDTTAENIRQLKSRAIRKIKRKYGKSFRSHL